MNRKFNVIFDEIRVLKDFDNFLLFSKKTDIMKIVKKRSIVIMNINDLRCDAFFVEKNRIRVIKLFFATVEIKRLIIKSKNCDIIYDILENL